MGINVGDKIYASTLNSINAGMDSRWDKTSGYIRGTRYLYSSQAYCYADGATSQYDPFGVIVVVQRYENGSWVSKAMAQSTGAAESKTINLPDGYYRFYAGSIAGDYNSPEPLGNSERVILELRNQQKTAVAGSKLGINNLPTSASSPTWSVGSEITASLVNARRVTTR